MQAWHRQVGFAPGDDLRGPSGSEGNRVWLASRGGSRTGVIVRSRQLEDLGRLRGWIPVLHVRCVAHSGMGYRSRLLSSPSEPIALISTVYSGRFSELPSVPGLLRSVGYLVPDRTRGDFEAFPDRGIEAEHPGQIAVILTGPPECASSCKSNSQTLVRFRDREVLMAPTGTASGFASRRGPGSTNCTVNGQRTEHDTEGRLPRSCSRQWRCWRWSPVLSPRRRSGHIGLHGGFATV